MKIGDRVRTKKGGRLLGEGPFKGAVVGFSKWRGYNAVNVRKDYFRSSYGRTVQCLEKNLVVIKWGKKP
jgi:hypothetical protein